MRQNYGNTVIPRRQGTDGPAPHRRPPERADEPGAQPLNDPITRFSTYIRFKFTRMFEAIDRFVAKYIHLSEEESAFFHSLLRYRQVRKKNFLLQEGEICDFEAFILKGCIRSYYLDKEGVETILLFAVEEWWVSDLASFSERKPSNLFIETLEDSELLYIDYASKALLFEKVPAFERMFRLLVQRSLNVVQQRFFAAVSQTAEERYLHFLDTYPQVAQRVPQHQIARYIGVSPEFLSKVRSTMYKK